MPLMQGKSQKAFGHNVSAEMDSGKPQNQSLAIAYAVKRRNQKANGGMIEKCAHGGPVEECYAHGGEADEIETDGDLDGDEFDMENAPFDDEVQNEEIPMDEEMPKKSRLLSKILGAIKQAHQNA